MYPSEAKLDVALRSRLFCGVLLVCTLCLGVLDSTAHNPVDRSPYSDWPTIASILDVGNNADESVEFTLQNCTAVRLFAVGEGLHGRMYDYGSIERVDTGQVVWQMYTFEADVDGWSVNRRVDRRLTLPAGDYRLRFRSNSSHSFDDWGQRPPEHRFWGIALYEDRSADHAPPECWETAANPKDLGWSTRQLDRLVPELGDLKVGAFMIVTDGQVIYEWGSTAVNFNAHSMRKSLISALYGIAVDRGEIDLSLTLGELGIDDATPLTKAEKEATIADLLKARSGVYIPAAAEAGSMVTKRPQRGSHAPGTFWYYNNWDFNALGTIFDQETGQENVYQAFKAWVADPIGMQDLDVERLYYRYDGHVHPNYAFRISARDLARFGQLYLQEGAWQGQQIVPSTWVNESTTAHSRTDDDGTYSGYGYLWWIATYDRQSIQQGSYAASGYGGHTLQILPDLNTVIVIRPNTDLSVGELGDQQNVDRLIIEVLKAYSPAQDARAQSLVLSMAWGVLVAGSLVLLIWGLVVDRLVPWGIGLVWTLITLFFGPLGPLAYWLLVHRPAGQGIESPAWQRAIGAALCSAAGNILGLLLVSGTFAVFIPSGSAGPLALVVPLLVGWLGFCAPLLAFDTGRTYWLAARKSLLVALVSTILISAGAVPVAALLQSHWHPYAYDPARPHFWAMHALAALAGALVVYPLNLWIAHRDLWVWPAQSKADHPPNLPSLRNLFPRTSQKQEL
jgi:CubicO group peptidase (beta-lactamase class C family)